MGSLVDIPGVVAMRRTPLKGTFKHINMSISQKLKSRRVQAGTRLKPQRWVSMMVCCSRQPRGWHRLGGPWRARLQHINGHVCMVRTDKHSYAVSRSMGIYLAEPRDQQDRTVCP